MRVLSLSHRMMNPLLDNHTVFNAPNFIDYDAIVLDIAGTATAISAAAEGRSEYLTHSDVPVANGDSVEGQAGLAELLQRRKEELTRALERGAVVCVYAAAPARYGGVAGLQGLDRYFLLPAPDGMAWDAQTIRGGEGKQAAVVDHRHPFALVYEMYKRDLLYRAYFNDRAPGFAKHAHVFIRSLGGAPLGVEFRVGAGRIVFMPTPREAGATWLAPNEGSATLRAMREMHRLADDDRPRWVDEVDVPGLPERQRAVETAKSALSQAEMALRDAEDEAARASALRDALWAGSESSLQAAVLRCAEALGFQTKETPEGDAVLIDGDTQVQLAVGASNEAVDMAPHYRLRQTLDAIIAKQAIAPRGVLVVNGQRLVRPEERKREFTDSLRVAAESVGYALVTATDLAPLALGALAGLPPERLAEVRRRLSTTNGHVTFSDLPAVE